ncbi:tRNA (uridine(54)-C5)-methyltransferase TrmA [Psittacicella gerlachiana]|uniref:tRNA (Uridine(54)-C5)-methyltransferase TrmA n=1 Tax=Psittacicella gerlachiana TaxID=2028574 RepID=A0A3A1Y9J6_9GAMM|nr:tRNA (uridine(54)-C5)-methyltransferase TrmA [Psittacicella gerlachiana]RIY34355.1 tRNA (uridine(54)-C5)-methyltransferase TrmA [Psittacicella gerlachiana]
MLLQEKISLYKDLIKNNLPSFALNNLDVFSGEQSGYRMRAEFGIFHQNTPNYQVLHFTHDPKTKERIFCHGHFDIATPLINSLMLALEKFCSKNYEFSHKLFQIEYLTTTTKQVIISLLFHRKLHEEQDLEKAQQLQEFLLQKNLIPTQEINIILRARKNKIIVGNNFIKEKFIVDNQEVSLYQVENSFSQPNAQINELMLNYVKKHASTKNDILELYCGVGNFTMVLAQIGRKVLATEVNKQAVEFVYKNLALNNIHNVEVGRISAEEFVQAIYKVRPFRRLEHIDLDSFNFDTVFVDPPRSGLDQKSCDMISKYPQIIYVSCNPQTLVENLQYLIEQHNYQIKHLALFDQFPQTSHCESVAILQRN